MFGPIKHNTFQYQEDSAKAAQTYEIDCTDSDPILLENGWRGICEYGPNIDRALKQYRVEYDRIQSTMQGSGDVQGQLTSTMDQIPQMTERKKKIDMHVAIAMKLLSEIQKRKLDKLQEFEDEIMGASGQLSHSLK